MCCDPFSMSARVFDENITGAAPDCLRAQINTDEMLSLSIKISIKLGASIHKAGRDTQTGTNKQRLNYRGRLRAVITNHYTPLLYSIASSPEPSCSRRRHPPLGLHSKCQKCNVWRVPKLLIPQMYAEIRRCKAKNATFRLRFSAKQSHVYG